MSTLPQYQCAKCYGAVSESVHCGAPGGHTWVMPEEYREFWETKTTGLMPIGTEIKQKIVEDRAIG